MRVLNIIKNQAPVTKEKVMNVDIVLVDASCDSKINGLTLLNYLTHARGIENLDPGIMRKYTKEFREISEFFQENQVHVVPEVYSEINKLSKVLRGRLKGIRNSTGLRVKRLKGQLKDNIERGLELLNPLENSVKELTSLSKNKVIDLRESLDYFCILNFVNYVSQQTGAKTDLAYMKGKTQIDKSRRLDADEKTIATAYYYSLNGKRTNILTKDYTDFNGLIGHTAAVLNLKNTSQSECALRESLLQFPVTAYYKTDQGEFKEIINSERAVRFKRNLPRERREMTIGQIDNNAVEILSKIN